jgi:NAD(P)-dependent dehydrogenase (short-subunit alcohol dehydrogenase family)
MYAVSTLLFFLSGALHTTYTDQAALRDDLEDVFRVNVAGVHNVTRAFLPLMRKGVKKTVLNM